MLRFFGVLASNYYALYNDLKKQSFVSRVARSSRVPSGRLLDSLVTARIEIGDRLAESSVVIKYIKVDQEFFNTYEVALAAGRDFSKDIRSDDSLAFMLNEASAAMLGMTPEECVGKEFQYGGVKGRIIGVVKDFHFESLHEPIVPVVFEPFQSRNFGALSVKLEGSSFQDGLAAIEKVWRDFVPYRPFEYTFLSTQYKDLYEAEQRQSQLFIIFAGLAILIACLGLFGLATFNTLQRVKEVGIRKVLGASVPSILTLLSREFVMLILIANLLAWPIAWYFLNTWLNTFAYHIDMGIMAYLLAGVAAVFIALVTVSSQVIKAAMSNPANTLRYE
jgi:putative ABC transport system permease protein